LRRQIIAIHTLARQVWLANVSRRFSLGAIWLDQIDGLLPWICFRVFLKLKLLPTFLMQS
jgi:hypothetical protein